MARTVKITPDMTVREINVKYPGCREVFNRHGMGGCGGQFGPPEPIDFFAKAHSVSVDELVADLQAAANAGVVKASETDDEKLSGRIYKRFVKSALFFTLTLGTVWGVQNLTRIAINRSFESPNYASVQGHGHAQTFGWVGLFIIGVAYYTIPKFLDAPLRFLKLASLTLPMLVVGIIARAIAQPFAKDTVFGIVTFIASLVEMTAILVFVLIILDVVKRSGRSREFFESYVFASLGWDGSLRRCREVSSHMPGWGSRVTLNSPLWPSSPGTS